MQSLVASSAVQLASTRWLRRLAERSNSTMILTLEIPFESKPRCWFAFDEDDFVRKVQLALPSTDAIVYSVATPREMLARHDGTPELSKLPITRAGILQLASEHGWDTQLYRADLFVAPGCYQSEPVSEFLAYVAALAHTLKTCRVYTDEEEAMDALMNDPLYAGKEGFYAHMALRDQLISLEVLADDM
jgi:hypothetical protein